MSQEFDCHYKDLSAIQKPLIELLPRIAVTDEDKGIMDELAQKMTEDEVNGTDVHSRHPYRCDQQLGRRMRTLE